MANRRLRKQHAELEITAFINLIVVLVPFLLSTAVFSRLAVLDLKLPAQNSGVEQLKVDNLQLEVVMRPDSLEVGDRIGGLIQRIDNTKVGYDTKALAGVMYRLKAQFPDKTTATLLAQPGSSYEQIVAVMDAMRATATRSGTQVVHADLFPEISLGDAPSPKR